MNPPKISCMCVTRGRPEFVARAVANFDKQTYPHRELVVVSENPGTLDQLPDYVVRKYLDASAGHIPVGRQRNACFELCTGDYVTVWDDDDFFAPDRLEYSLHRLLESKKKAFALSFETLLLSSGAVHHSVKRIWENSFLTSRALMQRNPYPEVQLGEDLHMVRLFRHRFGAQSVLMDPDYSKYVYVQHAEQTTSTLNELVNVWKLIPAKQLPLEEAKKILENCGAPYDARRLAVPNHPNPAAAAQHMARRRRGHRQR